MLTVELSGQTGLQGPRVIPVTNVKEHVGINVKKALKITAPSPTVKLKV